MESNIVIIDLDMKYAKSYWECFDSIIKERIYFAVCDGFPLEHTIEFLQKTYDYGLPFVLAMDEGCDMVVGWCDIQMENEKIGRLGMGVHANYRGRGIGERLIKRAIEDAKRYKYELITLNARHTNERAIKLYEKVGFKKGALLECKVPYDDENYDIVQMRLEI